VQTIPPIIMSQAALAQTGGTNMKPLVAIIKTHLNTYHYVNALTKLGDIVKVGNAQARVIKLELIRL